MLAAVGVAVGAEYYKLSSVKRIEKDLYKSSDGIYIEISHDNVIRGNRFEGLRFAVHYMYANNNEVSENISIRNHVGFALMYSKNLKAFRNISISDETATFLAGGCSVRLADHWSLDVQARYLMLDVDAHYTLSFHGTVRDDRGFYTFPLDSWTYQLGLKYTF